MALNKQVWVKQIMENFYPDNSFLSKSVDYTAMVENNRIHIAGSGIDPKVLINNSTYPVNIVGRDDEDNEIVLDTFSTENTIIRRPEAIEYSYDKLESVIRQHRATLVKATASKAIHAYGPKSNTKDTPIIETSGADADGRKRLKYTDILTLKELFDDACIPLEDRYLVLNPKHVTDLLLENIEIFKDLADLQRGTPFQFAGFGIYAFPYTPQYDSTLTKIAYDSETTGNFSSVAFYAREVMRADGDIFMYAKEDDPEERGTIVGFDKRFIATPIRGLGVGAIVSKKSV